ncbi:hypothetical protein [Streptomyces sp. NPDC015125]
MGLADPSDRLHEVWDVRAQHVHHHARGADRARFDDLRDAFETAA